MTPQQWIPFAVMPLVLLLVVARNRRARPLKPHLLWVIPALVLPLIGLGLWGSQFSPGVSHDPFGPGAWLTLLAGLVLGAVAGWWRGSTLTIRKAQDGSLSAQASPLGLILIVMLLAGRQALRPLLESHAADWHLNALALTDAFLLFAAALVVAQRIEMFIRARPIQSGEGDRHLESA